uniref:Beta/gamma crystallin 'Greek key' domain-containing protein n=1 Tax=Chrysemys picta bellii TaxID=8478 RepID=A0A8C3F1T3_CHRPI
MNPKITLYEHANYQGEIRVVTEATSLSKGSFNDRVSSHKVQSGAWLLCEHEDGSGLNYVARKDEQLLNYESINLNDKLSFLRPLRAGWREIKVVTEATSLSKGSFNDRVSSHKVQSGAWLLCEHEDGSGLNYVARKDEQLLNYESIDFNDKLSFLRPLRAGLC